MATLLPEVAIRSLLIADATVLGIVGAGGVYLQFPVEGASRGYLVLTRTSAEHRHHLLAASGLAYVSIQIDAVVAKHPDGAHLTLLDAVREALDGYADTVTIGANSIVIQSLRLQSDAESFDDTAGADATYRRATADYRLGHTETVPTF